MKRTAVTLMFLGVLGGCQTMHDKDKSCLDGGERANLLLPGDKVSSIRVEKTPPDGQKFASAAKPEPSLAANRKPAATLRPDVLPDIEPASASAPAAASGGNNAGLKTPDVNRPPAERVRQTVPSFDQKVPPAPAPGRGATLPSSGPNLPPGEHQSSAAPAVDQGGKQSVLSRLAPAAWRTPTANPAPARHEAATPTAVCIRVPTDPSRPRDDRSAEPSIHMFNSNRIVINYQVKEVGASGVSAVDLYYRREGQEWTKVEFSAQQHSPYVVEVAEEGLYGFTLLARNGDGFGKPPPQPGDEPQLWAEVDMTRPDVHLLSMDAAGGNNKQLTIRWKATDKNLSAQPITLSYAETAGGPWTVIVAGLSNTGRYVWNIPQATPRCFLVRVEAADLVGNVGADQTSRALFADLSQPDVSILSVEAATRAPQGQPNFVPGVSPQDPQNLPGVLRPVSHCLPEPGQDRSGRDGVQNQAVPAIEVLTDAAGQAIDLRRKPGTPTPPR